MNYERHLRISSKTWNRDSHGLFDYECKESSLQEENITENISIVRKKMEIKTAKHGYSKDNELLFHVRCEKEGKFFISNFVGFNKKFNEENINSLQNKIWYVIPSLETSEDINSEKKFKNEEYYLNIHDIVKLGRVNYSINEFYNLEDIKNDIKNSADGTKYNITKLNQGTLPVFSFINEAEISKNDENSCKYCYSNENSRENPLINLCSICLGGLKFTHFLCLKSWMKTKLSLKEKEGINVKSYNMKGFNCELCKAAYPFRFSVGEDIFDLIEIHRPINESYVILESLNQKKDDSNIKSIHVIKLEKKKPIILGRGHDSHVRINDISVSRSHARLELINGKLRLIDLNSKFGTLALLKRDLEIKEQNIKLQIGRTLVDIGVKGKTPEKSFDNLNFMCDFNDNKNDFHYIPNYFDERDKNLFQNDESLKNDLLSLNKKESFEL